MEIERKNYKGRKKTFETKGLISSVNQNLQDFGCKQFTSETYNSKHGSSLHFLPLLNAFGQNFVVNTEPLLTMETFAYCDLCQVMLRTRALNEHLDEKNHSKKVADSEKSTMQQKPRVDLNKKS